MKKLIIIAIIFCSWKSISVAQIASDALLYSRHYAGGTARSTSMSGAFGALGGDPSVLSTNPAGLAVYRRSEFTFTSALDIAASEAQYDDRIFKANNTRFIFNNVGYVHTRNFFREKGLQSVNFGIAYNRLSEFNTVSRINKLSANSSLLDEFVLNADSGSDWWRETHEGLASELGLIFPYSDNDEIFLSDYIEEDRWGQPVSRTIKDSGGIGELGFSFGLNFNHNLFVGASIGFQTINHREYYQHEEYPNDFRVLKDFRFRSDYTAKGEGINFKTGVIYRPIPIIRLGAAIHTPTHFWIDYQLNTNLLINWNDPPNSSDSGKEGRSFNYRLTTPWRYILSAAVIENFGLTSVDVEIVNYKKNRMTLVNDDLDFWDWQEAKEAEDGLNQDISKFYRRSINVKIGTEYRIGPFSLRGGVAYYENPHKNDPALYNNYDLIRNTFKGTLSYSAGIGFRNQDFFMDLAYSFTKHPNRIYDLYEHADGLFETARLQTNSHKALLTFGFRF